MTADIFPKPSRMASEQQAPALPAPTSSGGKLKKILRHLMPVALVLFLAGLAIIIVGMDPGDEPGTYTGYVVSENLYLSAPLSGYIQEIHARRGQEIGPGEPLFSMDRAVLMAQAGQAEAMVRQYEARLEYERASLQKAQANLAVTSTEVQRTRLDYERYNAIYTKNPGAISRQDLDHARSAAQSARQQDDAMGQEVAAATANIAVAQAQIESGLAQLREIQKQIRDAAPLSPVSGFVEDIMYRPGEWAQANAPVLSLVPYERILLRFYVPQAEVGLFAPGTRVELAFSGQGDGRGGPSLLAAVVNYVAPRPEYTPPVIYSLKNRDKLVFLVEALPENPKTLRPGQPIEVRRAPVPSAAPGASAGGGRP